MKLARYLYEADMTQHAFAARAGISQSTVSRIVLGEPNEISLRNAMRIVIATRGAVRLEDLLPHHDDERNAT